MRGSAASAMRALNGLNSRPLTGTLAPNDGLPTRYQRTHRCTQAQDGSREVAASPLISQGHSLACCPVTVGEIYAGMRAAEAALTAQFFSTLIWVETSFNVAPKSRRVAL